MLASQTVVAFVDMLRPGRLEVLHTNITVKKKERKTKEKFDFGPYQTRLRLPVTYGDIEMTLGA